MRHFAPILALLCLGWSLEAQSPLKVVRITPAGTGDPWDRVAVTFDRPIAGSLDHVVDPARILSISPAVPGRYEWRDPLTLQFVPTAGRPTDARVTVTVDTTFTSLDGSRLAAPVAVAYRVRGPQLLTTVGLAADENTTHVEPAQLFTAVYSDSVNAALFEQASRIEMVASCGGPEIAVRLVSQRRISTDDDWRVREAGGWSRDRSRDSLRRVVTFAPRRRIATSCAGAVVLASELAAGTTIAPKRFAFTSYGPLQVTSATCGHAMYQSSVCPNGPVVLTFTNPVKGADLARALRITPAVDWRLVDTARTSTTWSLETTLQPRTTYALSIDASLPDALGQRLGAPWSSSIATSSYSASASHAYGRLLVERAGNRTLAVEHVNIDTLVVERATIPDSLQQQFLSVYRWGLGDLWPKLAASVRTERFPMHTPLDRGAIAGVSLISDVELQRGEAGLQAVRVRGVPKPGTVAATWSAGVAVVQITDLAVTARIGRDQGVVWVTRVRDGAVQPGAHVTLVASDGRELASGTTDANGLVTLSRFASSPAPTDPDAEVEWWREPSVEGYVRATLGPDRAIVPVSRYDEDLSPWTFGLASAYGSARLPVATAIFAERGIYRPGESVHFKTIVRQGPLGSLHAPPVGDSIRLVLYDREGDAMRTQTLALSEFGTAHWEWPVAATAPVGTYSAGVSVRYDGKWNSLARTSFRVAEYRPPEFLVDVGARDSALLAGDTAVFSARGRYLFGAPMARSTLNWEARAETVGGDALGIPGTSGWSIGGRAFDWGYWWDDDERPGSAEIARGVDTLDAQGEVRVRVRAPIGSEGVPRRVILAAAVTDINRQSVGATHAVFVHPASFYLATRVAGGGWFWSADSAKTLEVRAVRPDGATLPGVRVVGVLERRAWHRARRERDGGTTVVGEWVVDTVSRCELTTSDRAATCQLTPTSGGTHAATFRATDEKGRTVATSLTRWVSARGWVPWGDETQFKMDLFADRDRYSPGDTATILIASPFTDVEAWLTVERERVLESRRIRLIDGAMTVQLPITEAYAPNVFVSVVLVRGRSTAPSTMDDPGRPTVRVGYTQLRVTPAVKRLQVAIAPQQREYSPGDTATLRLAVRDASGRGVRSEVTLWAVDEGVLALTGYRTPSPLDLLYAPRNLSMRLASNLVAVAPQIPDGDKLRREAGGGGGAANADVLRSQFKTTAFYLGSVITDAAGVAVARPALPENLTTFRVMAVAVTTGDRFGGGDTTLLVTRPVVARPAVPRFVRRGDRFLAGVVINRRDGAAVSATVLATANGATLTGPPARTLTLEQGTGSEARFNMRQPGESPVQLQFRVESRGARDAVQVTLPTRSDQHPQYQATVGVLHGPTRIAWPLTDSIDLARSRITFRAGPAATVLRGLRAQARVYPYECTEQVSSAAMAVVALLRSRGETDSTVRSSARNDLALAVRILSGRQKEDGSIGYWSSAGWSSPWLSALAGTVLLDARELGIAVDSAVVERLIAYQQEAVRRGATTTGSPIQHWYDYRATLLAERVAATDFLSRAGRADVAVENELVRMAGAMSRANRLRLAEMLLRRNATAQARPLVEEAWAVVAVDGNRAILPDSAERFYFQSPARTLSRLLVTTMALEPRHPLVPSLVEGLVSMGRQRARTWSSTDQYEIVRGLAAFDAAVAGTPATVRVSVNGRAVGLVDGAGELSRTLREARVEGDSVIIELAGSDGNEASAFYHVMLEELLAATATLPKAEGFRVERWYEGVDDGRPLTSVALGQLVRVRLRITTPRARDFVIVEDPLPAGLEAIDLSLRTSVLTRGGTAIPAGTGATTDGENSGAGWAYGRWEGGWWTPWEHRELRDDRVLYAASLLWAGTHEMTYLARATTPGTFIRPPTHVEEMYNRTVFGRAEGGTFTVTVR